MRAAAAPVAGLGRLTHAPVAGPTDPRGYFVTLGGVSGVAAWAWGEEVLA